MPGRRGKRLPVSLYIAMASCQPACAQGTAQSQGIVSLKPSGPTDPRAAQGEDDRDTRLSVLGIRINGEDRAEGVIVALRGGRTYLPSSYIRQMRMVPVMTGEISIEGEPFTAVDALAGATCSIDTARQVLVIAVSPDAFERTRRDIELPPLPPSPQRATAYVNYDLSVEHWAGQLSTGALLELGGATRQGNASASLLLANGRKPLLLESFVSRELPERRMRLVIGDAVTRASTWTAPIRFTGIRVGTDFTFQPGYQSIPTPSLTGEAALPSDIDLYVNSVLRAQVRVEQGPFELNRLPIMTGAGTIEARIRDPLGGIRTAVVPYYASSRLLRAGLTEYSLELGAERLRFAAASFDHGQLFFSGSYRYGVRSWLTGELHGETSRQTHGLGVGLTATLGTLAEAGGAVAVSQSVLGRGILYRVFAARIARDWSLSATYESSSRGFAQIGLNRSDERRLLVGANLVVGRDGNLTMTAGLVRKGDAETRMASLGFSQRIGWNASLSAFALGTSLTGSSRTLTFGLSLIRSLGTRRTAMAQIQNNTRNVEFQQSAPAERGWGYRFAAQQGSADRGQIDVSLRLAGLDIAANGTVASGPSGLRLTASGGLLIAGGSVMTTRRLDAPFAIVDAGGRRGVRVLQDNRVVARTGRRGMAVVPNLRPFEANRIGLEASDLDIDTSLGRNLIEVVPGLRGGVDARFKVGGGRAGTIVIEDGDAHPIPPGTRVRLGRDGPDVFAGYGGAVFVEDLVSNLVLEVTTLGGRTCLVSVPPIPAGESLPVIGPLPCRAAP